MKKNIVFTGHMIDRLDRPSPRFPQYLEEQAREDMRQVLLQLAENYHLEGIASGACGGDIIFHELCLELSIPTKIYLPFNPEKFRDESVDFVGGNWPQRFNRLIKKLPLYLLEKYDKGIEEINPYSRLNELMVNEAMKNIETSPTLLALWNGDKGDGDGGTWELAAEAIKQHFDLKIIPLTIPQP